MGIFDKFFKKDKFIDIDEYIGTDAGDDAEMVIADVFEVGGRGVVVVGMVDCGAFKRGDKVIVRTANGDLRTTITGIEVELEQRDIAREGVGAGLLLRGMKRSQINVNDIVIKGSGREAFQSAGYVEAPASKAPTTAPTAGSAVAQAFQDTHDRGEAEAEIAPAQPSHETIDPCGAEAEIAPAQPSHETIDPCDAEKVKDLLVMAYGDEAQNMETKAEFIVEHGFWLPDFACGGVGGHVIKGSFSTDDDVKVLRHDGTITKVFITVEGISKTVTAGDKNVNFIFEHQPISPITKEDVIVKL